MHDRRIDGEAVVFGNAGTSFHAFIRQVETDILTFTIENSTITDNETGSTWNFSRGLAVDGPLRGQGLQPVPSISAYDWAWLDFYPNAGIYKEY